MIKSFADIKRSLNVGATFTLTAHSGDWCQKVIGIPRTVVKQQTNAIVYVHAGDNKKFWLHWPKADKLKITGENTFDLELSEEVKASYAIN